MELNHAEHILGQFDECAAWAQERSLFLEQLCAAEFHWFFVQGLDAIRRDFFVPGVSSLLNGIEASLRVTIAQVNNGGTNIEELTPYRVLSNQLIIDARNLGMPVGSLAFPGEEDFDHKLEMPKSERIDVEIVRQRNNICHGNIFEFINRELGPQNSFFTPESLKPLAFVLLDISHAWAKELGVFRRVHGLLHYDSPQRPAAL